MKIRKKISWLMVPVFILASFANCFANEARGASLPSNRSTQYAVRCTPYTVRSTSYSVQRNSQLSIKENPYRFSSYYADPESGNYYCNARYYSPELMRFVNRDTYNLPNRYAYCEGNPVNNVDPSGHNANCENILNYIGIAACFLGIICSGGNAAPIIGSCIGLLSGVFGAIGSNANNQKAALICNCISVGLGAVSGVYDLTNFLLLRQQARTLSSILSLRDEILADSYRRVGITMANEVLDSERAIASRYCKSMRIWGFWEKPEMVTALNKKSCMRLYKETDIALEGWEQDAYKTGDSEKYERICGLRAKLRDDALQYAYDKSSPIALSSYEKRIQSFNAELRACPDVIKYFLIKG